MIATTTGERIRAYRMARGWSQEEMAFEAGISRTEIGRLERDEVVYPMRETISKLEKCFDLPLGTLFSKDTINDDEEDIIRRITQMLIQSDMDVSQFRQFEAIIGTVIDIVNEAVNPMSHRPYMYSLKKKTDK